MKARIKKSNFFVFLFGMIYVLEQNVLYLLPESNYYAYGAYLLILAMLLYIAFRYKIEASKISTKYALLFSLTFVLSIMASVVEVCRFSDASFFGSLLRQGQWWINSYIYIIAIELLKKDKVKICQLERLLVTLGIIQLIIGILQYFLIDMVKFSYVSTTIRLTTTRLRYPMVLMDFVCLWAAGNFFKGKNKQISIILILAVLFEAIFVEQFRSTAIGLALVMVIGFLIWKKVPAKKIIIGLLAVAALVVFYINAPFLQKSISFMFSTDTSLSMRSALRSFLIENFIKSPIYGRGWVSSEMAFNYASSPYRTYFNLNHFAFADGGIFSILYCYGVLGLLWVIALWWKMLTMGYGIFKKKNEYLYLLFPLFFVIVIYIDIHWYIHNQFFVLAIFCAVLEFRYKEDFAYRRIKEASHP